MKRLWRDVTFWLTELRWGRGRLKWHHVRMLSAMGCTCAYWHFTPSCRPEPDMKHAYWCNVTLREIEARDQAVLKGMHSRPDSRTL